MNDQPYIERQLTSGEIKSRTDTLLELLCERDDVLSAIDEKKREIKEIGVDKDRLEARIGQLRHEIRSGKVYEPRQLAMPAMQAQLADEDGNPIDDPRDKPAKKRRRKEVA